MSIIKCLHCNMTGWFSIDDEQISDEDLKSYFINQKIKCPNCEHQVYLEYREEITEDEMVYFVNVDFSDDCEEEIWFLNTDCSGFSESDYSYIEYDNSDFDKMSTEERESKFNMCDICGNIFRKNTGFCKKRIIDDLYYCKECYSRTKINEYL